MVVPSAPPAARRGHPAVELSPSGTIALAHNNGLNGAMGWLLRPPVRAYRGLLALASPWLAASATDYCRSVGKSGLPFLQRGTGLALFSEQVLGLDLSLGEGHADAVGIIG